MKFNKVGKPLGQSTAISEIKQRVLYFNVNMKTH